MRKFKVGQNVAGESEKYDVMLRAPKDLTTADFAICVTVIREGRAVNWKSAARELPHAEVLAIAYGGKQIVGVGAIKRSRPDYAAEVSEKSGVTFPSETSELGYVAVHPDHRDRHLSRRLVEALLSRQKGRLFATTDSERMKGTLAKAGFSKKGKEWKGNRGMLSFWERCES